MMNKQELIELIEDKNEKIEHYMKMMEYNQMPIEGGQYYVNDLVFSMAKKMVCEDILARLEQQNVPSE